jgi:hypothetical protein
LTKNFRSRELLPDIVGGTETIQPLTVSMGVNEGRFGIVPATTLPQQNGICRFPFNEETRNPLK